MQFEQLIVVMEKGLTELIENWQENDTYEFIVLLCENSDELPCWDCDGCWEGERWLSAFEVVALYTAVSKVWRRRV